MKNDKLMVEAARLSDANGRRSELFEWLLLQNFSGADRALVRKVLRLPPEASDTTYRLHAAFEWCESQRRQTAKDRDIIINEAAERFDFEADTIERAWRWRRRDDLNRFRKFLALILPSQSGSTDSN